jgi:hypothetical protein
VLKGRAKVTINGVSRVVTKDDGECTFRKYDVHDFCRADGGKKGSNRGEGEDDGEVIVEEWTDPGTSNLPPRKQFADVKYRGWFQRSLLRSSRPNLPPSLPPTEMPRSTM